MMQLLLAALCCLSLATLTSAQCSNGGTCTACSCPAGYGGNMCQNLLPWLYSQCNADSDCGVVSNTICYNSQCVCAHGYFYSVGTKQCVTTCASSDLQSTYTLYLNGGIDQHNDRNLIPGTEEQCKATCDSDPSCLNFEIYTGAEREPFCHLSYVTLLQYPNAWESGENWKFFVRNCA